MASEEQIFRAVKANVREVFTSGNIGNIPEEIIESLARRMLQGKNQAPSGSNGPSASGSSTDNLSSIDMSADEEEMDGEEMSTDQSEYQLVETKRRARKDPPKIAETIKKVKAVDTRTNSNYYHSLQMENRHVIQPKAKPVEAVVKKASRPPPIIAHGLNYKEFNKTLSSLENRPKFFIKMGSGSKCTIKPFTEEDREAIFSLLNKIRVESYTFTPKEGRKTTLVLKGCQHTFEEEEVKLALEEKLQGIKIRSVAKLQTARSKKSGKEMDAFIISFDAQYNTNEIMKVDRLLDQIIHWEKHITKGVAQCKRCQRFGHVASNCAQHYRCVKCEKLHGPGECARIKNDEATKPYCVNCQKEGHPANYRGCQKYKEITANKNKRREQQKQRELFARESVRNYVKPGMSYSQILNTNKSTNNPTNNPRLPQTPKPAPRATQAPRPTQKESDNFCTQESKALFGCDLFTLMGKINNFIPQYRKLTSLAERQSAYLQFAFGLCLGK